MDRSVQFSVVRRSMRALALVFALLLLICGRLQAQIVLSNANLATLKTALLSGGLIQLQFDSTIVTTTPLIISANTILDATGHNVTISGSGTRVFDVPTNISFTATNLIISGGHVTATNGANGSAGSNGGSGGGAGGNANAGGDGLGGGLRNLGNTTLIACLIVTNQSTGGNGGSGGNGGNGSFQGGNGGNGGSGGKALGGGIYNLGTLFVSNCTFAGNAVTGGNGGAAGTNGSGGFSFPGSGGAGALGAGGAIYNLGTVTVVNSTFNQNSTLGGGSQPAGGAPQGNGDGVTGFAGGFGEGAGIFNQGTINFLNSTFFANVSTGGAGGTGANTSDGFGVGGTGGNGGTAYGGSIYNGSPGTLNLTNCTFDSDAVNGGPAGVAGTGVFAGTAGANGSALGASLANNGGTLRIKNTILDTPTNGFLTSGTITDQGNNISFDGTPTFTTTNSHNHTDPLLATLDANGGPTLTIALIPGSPAIDAIFDNSAPPIDQRGFARPGGARSDIGAFEYGVAITNFFISGHVAIGSNSFANATISANGVTTTTDTNGNYSLLLAAAGNYTVAPQPAGFFSPGSSNIPNLSNNIANVNFTATNATARIAIGSSNGPFIQLSLGVLPTFSYRIQATTNITSSNSWVTIATNQAGVNGAVVFVQPTTNFPQRFFRAIAP